jgi:hypothetical protein
MDWNSLLNWKLLKGSHEFPGPDGGTCINEAAVVAAGFKYREINDVHDCPPCFSRVIAAFALSLNDWMDDALRQELLLPFVVRLAGTADDDNEFFRAQHIVEQTKRRILPDVMRLRTLCHGPSLLLSPVDAVRGAGQAIGHATIEMGPEPRAHAEPIFRVATEILDEAICMGKHAAPIEAEMVRARMQAAKLSLAV